MKERQQDLEQQRQGHSGVAPPAGLTEQATQRPGDVVPMRLTPHGCPAKREYHVRAMRFAPLALTIRELRMMIIRIFRSFGNFKKL
jgi:hypothetical protein